VAVVAVVATTVVATAIAAVVAATVVVAVTGVSVSVAVGASVSVTVCGASVTAVCAPPPLEWRVLVGAALLVAVFFARLVRGHGRRRYRAVLSVCR
jgi:hypothetical protein